jgi:transposase
MDLTDDQWAIIQPLIPNPTKRFDGKCRPWKDPRREVMNGILWILRTGAPWYDMPDRYSPYQTCHRRFQQWVRTGIFEKILHTLATDLRERGGLNLSECYIDGGAFIVAKKRGNQIGRETKQRGKGTKKLMAISDSTGIPISVHITSTASPHHEVTSLAEATVSKCFVSNEKPERIIGDKAYDSDPLDEKLAIEYGVELIAPHRYNRQAPSTQDGRPLRHCYKHRWKIERLFAWLQNFRCIRVRYEYHTENFLGLIQLGCIMILLRRCS